MINQQLLDFIKGQLQLGLTKEKITNDLLSNGWTAQDIEEGFKSLTPSVNQIPQPPTPTINRASTVAPPVIQAKNHSGKKIFLIVLVLLLLAGGASAYYFKDKLVSLPILKNVLSNVSTPAKVLSISVLSPNGGEKFKTGDVITTKWTYTTDCKEVEGIICTPPSFDLRLEKKEVSNNKIYNEDYTYIRTGVLGSSDQWTIPYSIPSGSYYVKVCQLGTVCEFGQSFDIVYDASAVVDITTDAKTITDRLQSQSPAYQEVGIKAGLNNLRAVAFSTTYSGFCLSREGKDALNQVKVIGGTNIFCKDSEKTFAVGVHFSSPTSEDWCVDSVNPAHVTQVFPTSALCP